ncbi:H-NS histone family protein [Burkholderia multivorans]|uniref:H-NS histone family protein n=1 Tax=Burkholderia multivorans TaxID=87883 RepID=UPI001C2453B5|nr:H-NS histone family protein [Burkholderia multivorans]MBU9118356.1 H-NS histone family protein [Burkholderia multivorans]
MAETTATKTAAAPKKLSLDDFMKQQEALEAQKKALEEQFQASLAEERPSALEDVLKKVKLFKFTADELGFHFAPATGGKGKGKSEGGSRQVNYTIKSTAGNEVGVWLAAPPPFLKSEGCFTTYESGKTVDGWLVDPNKTEDKAKFLAKLMKHTVKDGKEKEPTKEQLGTVTLEAVKAARAKMK